MLRSCSRSKTLPAARLARSDLERVQSRARRGHRLVHGLEQVPPACAHPRRAGRGLRPCGRCRRRPVLPGLMSPEKYSSRRVDQLQLVADRQLDVDALDGVGVLAQPLERNDDVLVDLERVGVLRDRRGSARSSQNLRACLGADGDEALARAGVGEAHDCARSRRPPPLVLADDVAEQHHLRQRAALRLGAVADGAQVALIQMLEAGENGAARPCRGRSR